MEVVKLMLSWKSMQSMHNLGVIRALIKSGLYDVTIAISGTSRESFSEDYNLGVN